MDSVSGVQRRRQLPSFGVRFVVLVSFCLATACVAQSSEEKHNALTKHLQEHPEVISEDDITKNVQRISKRIGAFLKRPWQYPELLQYYEKHYALLAEESKLPLKQIATSVLQSFSGSLRISSYDVLAFPLMLLTPERVFQPGGIRYARLEIPFKDKKLPGLRVYARRLAVDPFGTAPTGLYRMPYISTLNARAAGFVSARFVAELSSPRFEPADRFEYLGLQDWKAHSRLQAVDQLQGPISLTNVAHPQDERYVISRHPDYALQTNVADTTEALLTFYLFLTEDSGEDAIPDFIFQLVLEPQPSRM